ncbi:MAG: VacJ family lipoprotein [Rhodobacteraceae bacterium]|nr:VacJ family lipoprotein [Paracoccaceae bacterium]
MNRLFNISIRLPLFLLAGVLAACNTNPSAQADPVYDPYEATNRQVHDFNKAVDQALLAPLSNIYGAVIPEEFRYMLGNTLTNLGQPNAFVNHVLQGDGDAAGNTIVRFVLNSTIGLAGMFDPAAEIGVFDEPTDFGETLAAWGVGEGAYIELPLLGPSTVRDTIGMMVDFGIDPLKYALTDEQASYLFTARVLNLLGKRYEYNDLLQVLLYESADSYAAQRLSYLQNKRHALAGETTIDDLEDPYAFE